MWIAVGYVCGSVPWSILFGKLFGSTDARSVGDGNPGATNAWIASGWKIGVPVLVLDVSKGIIPVLLALMFVGPPKELLDHVLLGLVWVSPVVGHAWSPFLRFGGGKALASSWGVWIALTSGLAFPIGLVFLGFMHLLQNNHAVTVTLCLVGFILLFMPILGSKDIFIFSMLNLGLILLKHRREYRNGIVFRGWIRKLTGKLV